MSEHPGQGKSSLANELQAGWYVVRTKARQEKTALEHLERQNFTAYLPLIAVNRRRKGKWVEDVEALFPRYLFIHLIGSENISPIRSTRGVSELLRINGKPASIPEGVIQFFVANERADNRAQDIVQPVFQQNERVEVLEGPFSGLPAVYRMETGDERALVLIQLLGRQSEVHIPKDHLGKL